MRSWSVSCSPVTLVKTEDKSDRLCWTTGFAPTKEEQFASAFVTSKLQETQDKIPWA